MRRYKRPYRPPSLSLFSSSVIGLDIGLHLHLVAVFIELPFSPWRVAARPRPPSHTHTNKIMLVFLYSFLPPGLARIVPASYSRQNLVLSPSPMGVVVVTKMI